MHASLYLYKEGKANTSEVGRSRLRQSSGNIKPAEEKHALKNESDSTGNKAEC